MLVLARSLGVLGGPTSGANFAGALKYLQTLDAQATEGKDLKAAFIVCDRMEWYLSYLQKHRPELFGQSGRKAARQTPSEKELAEVEEVSVDEAEAWLKPGSDGRRPLIVDMRGGLAFKAGHLKDSVNIPQDNLDEMANWGTPFADNFKVLFVCPTGDVSKVYAALFNRAGAVTASLKGGFVAWRDRGKKIERAKPARRKK